MFASKVKSDYSRALPHGDKEEQQSGIIVAETPFDLTEMVNSEPTYEEIDRGSSETREKEEKGDMVK